MIKKNNIYEVTFADIEKITGFTYRTIRRKLVDLNPVREDHKSSYFSLKDVLPVIYSAGKNERERVTIAEIIARTRNWNVTADRGEIKRELEEGSVYPVDDVTLVLARMLQALKNKFESIPSRIASLDAEDYHGRLEIAEQIVDEALKEINDDAIRECSSGSVGSGEKDSEADAPTLGK